MLDRFTVVDVNLNLFLNQILFPLSSFQLINHFVAYVSQIEKNVLILFKLFVKMINVIILIIKLSYNVQLAMTLSFLLLLPLYDYNAPGSNFER